MDRFKFWQRRRQGPTSEPAPVIGRFNIRPRTDLGGALAANPDAAPRLAALRRRRETVLAEVAAAEAALAETNRWQAEINLIDQAITEIDKDLADLEGRAAPPGQDLPSTAITGISVETEPVARARFRIGDEAFEFAEEIDWAERGTQIARSELARQSGDPHALIPNDLPAGDRDRLAAHLEHSLFVFATDLRDRALASEPLPGASLSDLAKPDAEAGGWLDWSGNSPNRQRTEIERHRLEAERNRLAGERQALIEDQERTAEQLPVARRRLLEVEREIEAIIADS